MIDERIINSIVDAVLQEIRQEKAGAGTGNCSDMTLCQSADCGRLLVIGDLGAVPANLSCGSELLSIEDYIQYKRIRRYDGVVITRISLTQLSDIAQGRDSSPESCAVVNALLEGISVCMLEGALPHRRYADKHGSMMYQVIEKNVQLACSYGIKLISEKDMARTGPEIIKPPKYQAPPITVPAGNANTNFEKVITESMARAMVKKSDLAGSGEKQVFFAKGTIVTPAAKDIFKSNDVKVVIRRD